jgi:predicted Zn finger-like uncharacterized protein
MIVTCDKCNTNFDLDDELIQESGSEVKCSECQNVFTVHKPAPVEGPEPSPELEGDSLDLPPEEESVEEEFDIEALGLEEELSAEGPPEIERDAEAEETPEPVEEAPSEELDMEGLELEETLEVEGPAEVEEGAVEEAPEPAGEAPSEELDLEAISRAVEEAAKEPEPVSEEAPPEEEVLDFDLLEGEEEPTAEKPAEEAMDFEDLSLDEEPAAEEPALVEEAAVEEAPGPVAEEAVVEKAEAEEEPDVAPVEEKPMPPPVVEKAPPAGKRLSTSVMIVLVFGLLAGGVFGAYVLLKDRIPFLQSLTGAPKPATMDAGNLHIAILDDRAEFVENSKAGRVFVVKGMARNDYPEARNFIRVKGVLYSQDGKAVQEKLSYCGNALSDSGLETLDKASMDMKFQNRMGDERSNFEISPGKTVPFMVIFSDLPQDLGEYSVQVVSSAQAQ